MKLAEVAAARSASVIRVGWPALFLKGVYVCRRTHTRSWQQRVHFYFRGRG